jgi:hypothetical protein
VNEGAFSVSNVIRQIFLLSILSLGLVIPAQADLPATLKFDETELALNGTGMRKKWMMNIYKGGLYLQAPSSNAPAIIAADEAMAVRLDMVSGMITSEKMEEALMEGLQHSTGGNIAPIKAHVDAFMAVFQEEIKEGDVFDIAYLPGKGIDIYKNGGFRSTIDGGIAFKRAIFGIWLGDKPADKKLKSGMLGK